MNEIVVVLQLIKAIDEQQRVIRQAIVVLNIYLTDEIVGVPERTIDNQRVVVFGRKSKSRNFVVQIENVHLHFGARGRVMPVGGRHVEDVPIRPFAIERIENVDLSLRRREVEQRRDFFGWFV